MRKRHPIGTFHGRVTTHELGDAEVTDPAQPVEIADEDFPTPNGSISAVSGAVEAESDNWVGMAGLGHHRANVSVVVLDADETIAVVVLGPPAGEIAGVHIGDDTFRFDAKQPCHVFDCRGERIERLEVLHIPNVLAHEGVLTVCQTECCLEFSPDRQGRGHHNRESHRKRSKTTAAPHRQFSTGGDPDHRVVTVNVDGPIVQQQDIGELPEFGPCLGVALDDRFGRVVGRGHHPHVTWF